MNLDVVAARSRLRGRELVALLLGFAAFATPACGGSGNATSSLDGGG